MLPVGRSPDTICSASRCLLHPLVSLGRQRPSWKGPRLSVFTYPPLPVLSLDVSFPRLPLSRPSLPSLYFSIFYFICLPFSWSHRIPAFDLSCYFFLSRPLLPFLTSFHFPTPSLVSSPSCLLFSCFPFLSYFATSWSFCLRDSPFHGFAFPVFPCFLYIFFLLLLPEFLSL